jgi:dolichol-phosphate mannosyltransferase
MNNKTCDISVVIPMPKQTADLAGLLSQIRSTLEQLLISHEIIIAGRPIHEDVQTVIHDNSCIFIDTPTAGYGEATRSGIRQSIGRYVIALEADSPLPAGLLSLLWTARETADVVIASRYVPGGEAKMPYVRKIFSKILNLIFGRGLDLDVHDMSSSYRLYKSHVIKDLTTQNKGFDILQEILVRILLAGYSIKEIPIKYQSIDPAYERMVQFGLAYFKTFWQLWKLRNSIASADYDARAYNATMPPQRYWQRQRYKHITTMLQDKGKCLDVGCGSSRIIGALPEGSIALDILMRKLRYARRFGHATVQGSIFDLPFPDNSFPCVLCSQVIEHVPRANVLDELDRVLQSGGFLILGTPDYAKWQWNIIEWLYKVLLPQAYADEHITHYTYRELHDELVTKRGYKLETTHYILQGELILGLRKTTR